jgi:hypothetical protein
VNGGVITIIKEKKRVEIFEDTEKCKNFKDSNFLIFYFYILHWWCNLDLKRGKSPEYF